MGCISLRGHDQETIGYNPSNISRTSSDKGKGLFIGMKPNLVHDVTSRATTVNIMTACPKTGGLVGWIIFLRVAEHRNQMLSAVTDCFRLHVINTFFGQITIVWYHCFIDNWVYELQVDQTPAVQPNINQTLYNSSGDSKYIKYVWRMFLFDGMVQP